mmetsp:Transcript_87063/g.254772  ORF Transcript_87063/g.254772 Transcript_87063/m.254772 type:complete len:227 (-) Transcript_87063:599-1279(-)
MCKARRTLCSAAGGGDRRLCRRIPVHALLLLQPKALQAELLHRPRGQALLRDQKVHCRAETPPGAPRERPRAPGAEPRERVRAHRVHPARAEPREPGRLLRGDPARHGVGPAVHPRLRPQVGRALLRRLGPPAEPPARLHRHGARRRRRPGGRGAHLRGPLGVHGPAAPRRRDGLPLPRRRHAAARRAAGLAGAGRAARWPWAHGLQQVHGGALPHQARGAWDLQL